MIEKQADSIREIEDIVSANFDNEDTCFRGQSNVGWNLIPSAYRTISTYASAPNFDSSWVAQVERDTYREFDISADNELRGLDILERLSRAQHHGVPTRLLDWSINLTVAAFFAASSLSKEDCAIWCLNLSKLPFPNELGRQHKGGGYRIENINKLGGGVIASFAKPVSSTVVSLKSGSANQNFSSVPKGTFIVWKPHRVDERLQRQEGLLSWYHSFEDDDLIWDYSSHIHEIENNIGHELLLKIIIPFDKKKALLEEVIRRGITEHYLFANLDGLGSYLAREHFDSIEFNGKP